MELFAGLDVSVRTTSICVMDRAGKIIKQGKVESDPAAIGAMLGSIRGRFKRVGLEAGPLSQWLYSGLAAEGYPVICVETRHMRAALSAQVNKSDRGDARGIAQMMRVGLFKPVHVKTPLSQRIRVLLTTRKFLQHKAQDTQNIIRSMVRNFGIKVGLATRLNFHQRVVDLLEPFPDLRVLVTPLLEAHRTLLEQYNMVQKAMKLVAKDDEVCQLLMTAPGVGPLVALSFRAGVDEPARFARSRSVPVHFGLTPRRHQSGEKDRMGAISKFGDASVRWALTEGAGVLLLVSKRSSPLKEWGLEVAKRRGIGKAVTAVARRLAVILHRMWIEQTPYRWDAKVA